MTRSLVLGGLVASLLMTAMAGAQGKAAGMSRDRVREVQQALKASGHDPGPIDGILGPRTKAALRSYASAPSPLPPSHPSAPTIDRFRRDYPATIEQSP
jgi:peptidoglycan hydrolase-like protein with peptidoglycan-binding domain